LFISELLITSHYNKLMASGVNFSF